MSDEFNKKIAKDFGLGNMSDEEQRKMIEKIGNLLFESVVDRAVDVLDEEGMNNLEEIIAHAEGDYQKVLSFMKDRVPGFNKIVSEELSRLKRATSSIFA